MERADRMATMVAAERPTVTSTGVLDVQAAARAPPLWTANPFDLRL
jgi:hypothetical protein